MGGLLRSGGSQPPVLGGGMAVVGWRDHAAASGVYGMGGLLRSGGSQPPVLGGG
ncbi:MAG TPA: hypothetical protein GYA08_11660, partial [Chloroflexi bacterium]|nr:hypothetical protein [Chloroflexota bacterium]